MEEKRIKIIVDKKGNLRFKTISGFAGENCQTTADIIMAGVGSCVKQGATDDADKFVDDPSVFATH